MEDVDTDIYGQIDKWNKEFYSWVLIKSKRTDSNAAIHDGFRNFCDLETDSNYTQGLKRLLEYYEIDAKYEILSSKILELEEKLAVLTEANKNPVKKEESIKVF